MTQTTTTDVIDFDALRGDFCSIWRDLFAIYRASNPGIRTQAALAGQLDTDEATLSRVFNGKDLPRDPEVIVKLAKGLNAAPREVRVLLIWAAALAAHDTGGHQSAQLLASMFMPLFDGNEFGRQLIEASSIIENILVDLGMPHKAAKELVHSIIDHREVRATEAVIKEASQFLIFNDVPEIRAVLKGISIDKLRDLQSTYTKIAAPTFRLSASKAVRRSAPDTKAWDRIPNLVLTRIELDPDKSVKDGPHSGFEFLILLRGSGKFTMKGITPIRLSEDGRQFIGYKPSDPHAFNADALGASLMIVSYLQRKHDPTRDVLSLLKSRVPKSVDGADTNRKRLFPS